MQYSYRITKYFSSGEDGRLISGSDEWTSFSQIHGDKLESEYQLIENNYLSIIRTTCNHLHTDNLIVMELENYNDDKSLENEQQLTIDEAMLVAKKVLREELWCKLISQYVEFHFGYDFYMYVTSNHNLLNFFVKNGFNKILNIEEFQSPYL
ncbi:hypothetical protein QQF54_01870 [Lelliottia sp. V106_10]|uniref:hypothetical protein n=1 Tax=Lelliottia wanjuensis TaxID=3050585 RepID=UPI0025502EC5|nr:MULTISPECIES: hypothetical protein [unclassified Lelliottia]MDK9354893.1 hypothetical protein [Lelliottia sp. V106_16]MDK9372101.1 hypothetical protein [Lelliottia sp. V106_10]MDK9598737.1 hypothetical protein [Lelliottia sp. V106_5]